jgi:hypothetical protein
MNCWVCYHFPCCKCNHFWSPKFIIFECRGCYNFSWFKCYHFSNYPLCVIILLSFDVIIFAESADVIIFVLSFFLVPVGCFHLCFYFFQYLLGVIIYVIIFPNTRWVLSFMLSFDVIFFCYYFPLFSLSWKRDTLCLETDPDPDAYP